jgi:hypothetical protein
MGYKILNSSGRIIGYVETETEAKALMDAVPEDIYTFFVGGATDHVDKFFLDINTGNGSSLSFFDMLSEKYGKIPDTIIPFEEIREAYFKNNTVFLKIAVDLLDSTLVAQLLSVLRRTVPTGSSFFVLVERREIEEGLTLSSGDESIDVFYSPELPDELHEQASETLIYSPILRG